MSKARVGRGLSKADWLEGALQLLDKTSVAGLTIAELSRSLRISKSGFYWHFQDRDELLREMLAYWMHEITEVVVRNPEIKAMDPKSRLTIAAQMILAHRLTRYEISVRQWALEDREAAKTVRKANRIRLDFVRTALSELGFTGEDLEMRSLLFVCYHTWELPMFPDMSKKRLEALIARRMELLTN